MDYASFAAEELILRCPNPTGMWCHARKAEPIAAVIVRLTLILVTILIRTESI
jgi:hypothetical protein